MNSYIGSIRNSYIGRIVTSINDLPNLQFGMQNLLWYQTESYLERLNLSLSVR